jgi:3-deoxy-manno-octulosonate cytidylyltransferase (CMP-KDO synthetase)
MLKKTDRVLVVVPARMASSRYPGKPLVFILGLPMVEHVRRRALLAKGVDEVLVATCDLEIKKVVESFGGKAVMTSDKHERCTERVAEAAQKFSGGIVVNVQGDEPLLSPKHIETTLQPFQYPEVSAVSLLSPIRTEEDRNSPGVVKAVCRTNGDMLFYTRSTIPHYIVSAKTQVYRETGIRAFRSDILQKYAKLAETQFEKAEAVDMLRMLEHGLPVRSAVVEETTSGVDYLRDVAPTEEKMRKDPCQQALLKQYL